MIKLGTWHYALIDDDGHTLSFSRSNGGRVDRELSFFLGQCVNAHYDVLEDRILNFRWCNIKWNYALIICDDCFKEVERCSVHGFRMVVHSPVLTPYYQLKNVLDDPQKLAKYFLCQAVEFKDHFKYNLQYENTSCGYKIIFDIIFNYMLIEEKNGKLIAKFNG
jgi:hypothetical protein